MKKSDTDSKIHVSSPGDSHLTRSEFFRLAAGGLAALVSKGWAVPAGAAKGPTHTVPPISQKIPPPHPKWPNNPWDKWLRGQGQALFKRRPRHPIKIYDASFYAGPPSGATLPGFTKLYVAYEHMFFDRGENRQNLPRASKLADVARKLPRGLDVCIDIEAWKPSDVLHTVDMSDEKARSKLASTRFKYLHVYKELKKRRPDIQFGFYRMLGPGVSSNLWKYPIKRWGGREWGRLKADVFSWMHGWPKLHAAVDQFFPDMYGWGENTPGKELGGKMHKYTSRLYGTVAILGQWNKPVRPFLWMRNPWRWKKDKTDGSLLHVDVWRTMVEACLEYADGFALWSSNDELRLNTPGIRKRLAIIREAVGKIH